MSYTNDLKEQHLDQLWEWVYEKKYNEAMDWCAEYPLHADDDCEKIIEIYMEENAEALWEEYFNLIAR